VATLDGCVRALARSAPIVVLSLLAGCARGTSLGQTGTTSQVSSSGASSSGASSTGGTGGAATGGAGGAGHGGHGGSGGHGGAGHGGSPVHTGSGGGTSSGTGGSTGGTCSDGVQNQGEMGVDCGGPCPPCACPTGNCALRFNGAGNYVSVPPSAALDFSGSALTVEAWVYFDNLNSCMAIVRKGTSSSPTYDYWLHKNQGPADSVFWASWSAFAVNGFSAVTAGAWHHMAGVYDPGAANAVVYVDGQSKGASALGGAMTPNGDELRIGIDWDFGCSMAGVIDEVRISSVARYTGPFVPSKVFVADASTRALWHFDEYAGAVAHDASGQGNHGTLHGATWTMEHP
jgi:hypothetical protein